VGLLGSLSHDVHVTTEHVEQLRQLIEVVSSQESTEGRDAGVVDCGPPLPLMGSLLHRAELVHREHLTAQVSCPPVCGAGPHARLPAVSPDAALSVHDRPL
jgi:hypothetical protein